jgi:hypothetical protein
MEIMPRVAL